MTRTLKRTMTLTLLALSLALALATSAFASSHAYSFFYAGQEHTHSSSYINGPAEVNDGNVTITLGGGDYFPELKVGGVSADRSFSGGLTTFTFPGDASDDIDIQLNVAAGPHNTWYNLTLVWK